MADFPARRTPLSPAQGGIARNLAQPLWVPRHSPWTIAVVVAMAAFMEVLDISIANVALPHMAGNLGATNEESTWVLTSYLVSNAIVLPISGWIAGQFGRKRFFMVCLVLFTISSMLCGMAPSLGLLILFRVMQGMGGGGLQPMAQAIMADTFPPHKRGLGFAVYGVTTVLAPTIGPTLGGWITDSYSWRWIFYINLPVGVLALFLVSRLVEDPPYMKAQRNAGVKVDYIGFALLALGVGALQIMLDKGQEEDWFGSHFIVTLAIIATVCLLALIFWEWYRKEPLIDVHLFRHYNFLASNVMMFILGAVLFSSLVMLPLFLQTLMGYTAENAGLVLSTSGVITLLELPLVGQLTTKIQARYLAAFGWLLVAMGTFYTTGHLNFLMSFGFAQWMRVLQTVGLPFLFVPITLVAYVGLPAEKSNSIAGLLNFMRNIGSSVGTSLVTTCIAQRAQHHQVMLASHFTPANTAFVRAVNGLSQHLAVSGMGDGRGPAPALARIYRAMVGQATALAYIDTFAVLAWASSIMFFLAFVLRRNDPHTGGGPAGG